MKTLSLIIALSVLMLPEPMGEYTITHYTNSVECCGKTDGITASGAMVRENHTIAASKEFPFGTKLLIDGQIYTVEDRGGSIKGNRLDIFVGSREEAISRGKIVRKVWKVK